MKKVPSHEGTFCVFTRFSAMSEAKKKFVGNQKLFLVRTTIETATVSYAMIEKKGKDICGMILYGTIKRLTQY